MKKNTLLVIIFLFFSSCTVRLVADYDSNTVDSILGINKEIDEFYDYLILGEKSKRFKENVKDYVKINSDLKLLLRKNEIKENNKEMTRNIFLTDSLWNKYQQEHQKHDSLSAETFRFYKKLMDDKLENLLHSEAVKKLANKKQ